MNVLFVDDQRQVVDTVSRLVQWQDCGVDEIFTALSAKEAKHILLSKPIDMLITDIEMPGEDGLSLQKWQKSHFPLVSCIFLTSHADFLYAQDALRNGAFDYILQPARIADIEAAVKKCASAIRVSRQGLEREARYEEQKNSNLRALTLTLFLQGDGFQGMKEWESLTGTSGEKTWYYPCVIHAAGAEKTRVENLITETFRGSGLCYSGVFYTVAALCEGRFGAVLYSSERKPDPTVMTRFFYYFQMEMLDKGIEVSLFLGRFVGPGLPGEIKRLLSYCEIPGDEKRRVYITDEKEAKLLSPIDTENWSVWLSRGDGILVLNQISSLVCYPQGRILSREYLSSILLNFLDAVNRACIKTGISSAELYSGRCTFEGMLLSTRSGEQFLQAVTDFTEGFRTVLSQREGGSDAESTRHEKIQKIRKYLEEHMDRMVTREEAAGLVFLNEDYFYRLFKQETGKSYKEYVLDIKMDYAETLLKKTELPVAVVAAKVGYENLSNFTFMFRKMKGKSPTEARKEEKRS